jgi:3-oxoacyl-(acyl-carrier-protein) synthase
MNEYWSICAADVVTAVGDDASATWRAIRSGRCGIRPVTTGLQVAGRAWPAGEIPWLREGGAEAGSPAYSLAVRVGRRALEQARLASRLRTGLVVATAKAGIDDLERRMAGGLAAGGRHFLPGHLARDVGAALGLGGPVVATSNACASGLVALAEAARLLASGAGEAMLVIGVDLVSQFVLTGFSSLAALSMRPCRPFDAQRDGLSLGEGAAAVVLRRGRWPGAWATIRGWSVTNDATHITAPSRTGAALKQALEQSLRRAGLTAAEVGYVNAHGTGTLYNDETESLAIHAVFGEGTPVSSFKGYIGHTMGAAGVIEAVLCAQALREGLLPASLGLERLGVSKPIGLLRENLAATVEHAVTIKCGFGGVNAAMVLSRASDE